MRFFMRFYAFICIFMPCYALVLNNNFNAARTSARAAFFAAFRGAVCLGLIGKTAVYRV